jgi:glyoxalase family protein
MALELTGMHHLTAITANAKENLRFYTQVLGLRLVKRTVNQDDTTAYHLFYGDGKASPGSDITFFDWPAAPEQRGTHSVVRTAFRVEGEASLSWWKEHLEANGVATSEIAERAGHMSLDFEDSEGQRLRLVNDTRAGGAHPWDKSPVPARYQIKGLGPITMSVPQLDRTELVLTRVMNMRKVREHPATETLGAVHVYAMGPGGASAELHVAVEPGLPFARQGAGAVHHIAFRTPDQNQLDQWVKRTAEVGLRTSGEVERYYFTSLYFREPNGILFEIATDGPGFDVDEPMETLGEKLALPPFLEPKRASIEAGLKPID